MRWFLVAIGIIWAATSEAQLVSMLSQGTIWDPVKPAAHGAANPSLFSGSSSGLFAPIAPGRTSPFALYAPERAALRDLIARAEAGPKGYDAIHHGARVLTERPPTQMTIQGIFDWIDATPNQPHAIGRYQFIPATLRELVERLNVDPANRFSERLQDRLANALLEDADLALFSTGRVTQTDFMNNLAQIWAGFPNSTGKSHYHGFAGNKATMSWAQFETAISEIFGS